MTTQANNLNLENPMILGGWEPVDKELVENTLTITGTIPHDLKGSFFRNGPNPEFEPSDLENYHFFDGDGMIHQIEILNGEASYKNKWVETKCLKIERDAGKSLWKGFNSPPDFDNEHGVAMKHPANTNIVFHNGKLMALWEAGLPYEMTLPDLETVGEMDFDGKWPHAFTAHPKIDPENGDMVTFYYSILAKPHLKYGVMDKNGKVVNSTGIDLEKPVMIHDLAITKNYSVFAITPYEFSLERAMQGEYPFAWEPESGTKIGVIPRYADGAEIQWFDVDLGHIQHVFSAYEEGDEIVYHVCRSQRTSLVTGSIDDFDIDAEHALPYEYRLNLTTGGHTEEIVEDIAVEFSRINDDYTGAKYQYGYACRFRKQAKPEFDALVKFDFEKGCSDTWELDDGWEVGEFVFAPRENASEEDDGYCLGIVTSANGLESKLLIIDAKDIEAGPLASIAMPVRVPNGFHTNWVSYDSYKS
jgi:carotenoid cleavage dioxygenase-like enzyme